MPLAKVIQLLLKLLPCVHNSLFHGCSFVSASIANRVIDKRHAYPPRRQSAAGEVLNEIAFSPLPRLNTSY
jgi:hypothetical protein